MEKKTYQKPKTKVIELKVKQQLLQASTNAEFAPVTKNNTVTTW